MIQNYLPNEKIPFALELMLVRLVSNLIKSELSIATLMSSSMEKLTLECISRGVKSKEKRILLASATLAYNLSIYHSKLNKIDSEFVVYQLLEALLIADIEDETEFTLLMALLKFVKKPECVFLIKNSKIDFQKYISQRKEQKTHLVAREINNYLK